MRPLSRTKRRIYLVFLSLAFLVLLPIIILYARGYRLTEALKLGQTGGFYIATTEAGSEIYIDGKFTKRSGLLLRNILVQNLKPDTYNIQVSKEGFQIWKKRLVVFPETVTEAYPFMLPTDPEVVEIAHYTDKDGFATTTVPKQKPLLVIENPEYIRVSDLFKATSTVTSSAVRKPTVLTNGTSTQSQTPQKKLSVENEKGTVVVRWLGKVSDTPIYFCQLEFCKSEITVRTPGAVRAFDFYPGRGDLLIVSLQNGIYVVEIDDRSEQNVQKLYAGESIDFKVDQDIIHLKKGDLLFSFST